jgi:hypothetical protein
VAEAFAWARALAASSLVLGGLPAFWLPINRRTWD